MPVHWPTQDSEISLGEAMFTERQIFRCQNRACGCEMEVTKTPVETKANPRCFCGTEMKKSYRPPVFRTLDPDDELVSRFEADRNLAQ